MHSPPELSIATVSLHDGRLEVDARYAIANTAESGLPRRSARGLRKEPSAAGTSRAVRWFNLNLARHCSRPIVARRSHAVQRLNSNTQSACHLRNLAGRLQSRPRKTMIIGDSG